MEGRTKGTGSALTRERGKPAGQRLYLLNGFVTRLLGTGETARAADDRPGADLASAVALTQRRVDSVESCAEVNEGVVHIDAKDFGRERLS